MTSTAAPDATIEQQLREMNDALLVSSVHQHELAEQAQQAEAALREAKNAIAPCSTWVPWPSIPVMPRV